MRETVDVDQQVDEQGACVMPTQRTSRVATAPTVSKRVPPAVPVAPRYADLVDRHLATVLSSEDIAEEDGLNPLERITCRLHRRWLHHCVSSPTHVIAVTGHRWCRSCGCPVNIAVDELTADIQLTCPHCHNTPHGPATRQIVRCCRASIAAAGAPWSIQDGVVHYPS